MLVVLTHRKEVGKHFSEIDFDLRLPSIITPSKSLDGPSTISRGEEVPELSVKNDVIVFLSKVIHKIQIQMHEMFVSDIDSLFLILNNVAVGDWAWELSPTHAVVPNVKFPVFHPLSGDNVVVFSIFDVHLYLLILLKESTSIFSFSL
jgi:hypothetical protein